MLDYLFHEEKKLFLSIKYSDNWIMGSFKSNSSNHTPVIFSYTQIYLKFYNNTKIALLYKYY